MTRFAPTAALLVPIAFLLACTGFVPADGDWVSDSFAWTDDGCGVYEGSGDRAWDTKTLTNNDDGTFTLVDVESDFDFVCTRDAKDFTCSGDEKREPMEGTDATIVSDLYAVGGFADEETVAMDMTVAMSCEGADCVALMAMMPLTIPCESTAHIEASWAGE